jgi:hypothetical protein
MIAKTGCALALLAMLLMSGNAAFAQKPAATATTSTAATTSTSTGSKTMPVTPMPDMATLNTEHILQQLTSSDVQSDGQDVSPLQVVAEFLQLQPPQISALGQLLEARQTALVPLFETAQQLTQQLGVALNNGANPAQVGALLIQIHGLQQQMAQAQQAFVAQFLALLVPDQLQQLQAVQIAVQVQPVLPAFKLIFLF